MKGVTKRMREKLKKIEFRLFKFMDAHVLLGTIAYFCIMESLFTVISLPLAFIYFLYVPHLGILESILVAQTSMFGLLFIGYWIFDFCRYIQEEEKIFQETRKQEIKSWEKRKNNKEQSEEFI